MLLNFLRDDFVTDELAQPDTNQKTAELILPDGFVRGAYQAGVLKVLVPHLLKEGIAITHISARSIGSLNAVILAGLLNSNQSEKIPEILGNVWQDLGKIGDTPLIPLRSLHKVTDLVKTFNHHSTSSWFFPHMPGLAQLYFLGITKKYNPLNKLAEILDRHVTKEMWDAIRHGEIDTSLRVSKLNVGLTKAQGQEVFEPVDVSGSRMNKDAVLSSCAAKVFGPHNGFWDGTYTRKSLYPAKARTDIIISIPCIPDNEVLTKREMQAEGDRKRLSSEENCTVFRLDPPSNYSKSSSYNFTSRHIQYLDAKGQEKGQSLIENEGAALVSLPCRVYPIQALG
ncbi:MAG: hypothetical protein DI586_09565 [Micavibrio aeruginosavorus]|uniref:PNPLA domain-containing protein n=1 Tax=Micavibrio aeruginosavorus TaxID=349221 RepID=A0A2W5FEW0_9BACT|nr:MAG: hypothetical protein DI586_09565 [Micavibrio aeruginosavorus]